jgi:hypothetical protein
LFLIKIKSARWFELETGSLVKDGRAYVDFPINQAKTRRIIPQLAT